MGPGLIDSHAHLSQPDFDSDRSDVIKRAKAKGLSAILSIATEPQEMTKEISLARQHQGFILSGLGYHPHIAKDINDSHYEILKDLIQANKETVAIGEIGLDYYYKHSEPKTQEGVFREQLRLAADISLPVIIHCRNAYPQMIRILKTEHIPSEKVLIHCFSGDSDQAEELLAWGATISFAGPVTYPKAENLRNVLRITPLNKLLVETDAPYLSPQGFRGKRNEPEYILETYEKIAYIKDVHIDELIEKVVNTFSGFFNVKID